MDYKTNNNEIVIFENQNIKLEVNMKDETVWLSQQQMAELFGSSRTNIIDHINNIYKDKELDKNSTCQNFRQVRLEGKRKVSRIIPFYNLDMIISVGYRVKSKNGVIFRKCANEVLKEYLLKGYAVNQKRLDYLEKTIKSIDIAGRIDTKLNNAETIEIIKVINNYKDALNLLNNYDYKIISKIGGTKSQEKIKYEDCIEILNRLKLNSNSSLFALEKDKGLLSIINDIYSSFNNKDVYPTIEEKAANFLYLIIKNHVFVDGNKRVAATLFIYFLNFYNILYKNSKQVIDNKTLVAITLLIAQSNPNEKDILIDLIINFLNN